MKSRRHIWFVVLVVVYSAFFIAPVVALYIPSIIRLMLCAWIWGYIISGTQNVKGGRLGLGKLVPLYLLTALQVYLAYAGYSTQVMTKKIYESVHLVTITASFFYIVKYFSRDEIRRICIILLSIIFITAISTYFGNIAFPGASRITATAWVTEEEINLYSKYNIGSFDFTYMLVLVLPLLIYIVRFRKLPLVVSISLIIIVLFTVFRTEYTTAIIFSFICLSLFFIPRNITPGRLFLFFGLMFVVVFIASYTLSMVLSGIADMIESSAVKERLQDIASVMIGAETNEDSDLEGRSQLWLLSWNMFLKNPLGAWSLSGGGHSYFLDTLARFGIIGLLFFIIYLVTFYKTYIKTFRHSPIYSYVVFFFIIYLIQLVLNPQPYLFTVTFVVPLLSFCYSSSD